MAVTQEQIDAQALRVTDLDQMIADGVRQATVRGQTLTYNTTDSLIKARDDAERRLRAMQAELNPPVSGGGSRVQLLYHAGRGYD